MAKFTPESARLAGMKSSRKGVKDKTTEEVKRVIRLAVGNELEALAETLELLRTTEPKAYLDALIKLLPYVVSRVPETSNERAAASWPTSFVYNVLEKQ
jgi:hypothetical protein